MGTHSLGEPRTHLQLKPCAHDVGSENPQNVTWHVLVVVFHKHWLSLWHVNADVAVQMAVRHCPFSNTHAGSALHAAAVVYAYWHCSRQVPSEVHSHSVMAVQGVIDFCDAHDVWHLAPTQSQMAEAQLLAPRYVQSSAHWLRVESHEQMLVASHADFSGVAEHAEWHPLLNHRHVASHVASVVPVQLRIPHTPV